MKRVVLLALACMIFASASAVDDAFARTYFQPRPQSMYGVLMHDAPRLLQAPQPGKQSPLFSLSHSLFYHQSNATQHLLPYFFGGKKKSLLIDEKETGDINPNWLDIRGKTGKEYTSTLTMSPQREVYGAVLSMTQAVPAVHDGAWLRLTVPVCKVRHDLRLTEAVKSGSEVDTTGSGFTSVAASMDAENLRAARINSTPLTLWGVDDVLLHAGITMRLGSGGGNMQWYLEGALPVGQRPSATYLFEPVQGSAGHGGLGIGMRTVMPLAENQFTTLSFCSHLHYRVMTAATQLRTLDLKGHQFSRYLVYMDSTQGSGDNFSSKAARGANFFTREMQVSPGGQGQSMQGLLLSFGAEKQHSLHLNYTYWWRMAEQITFKRAADRTFAVPEYGTTTGTWLPSPLINEVFVGSDASAVPEVAIVYDNELNLSSAAAPQTASHLITGGFETTMATEYCQFQLHLAAACELAENRAMLDAWSLWGRVSMQW